MKSIVNLSPFLAFPPASGIDRASLNINLWLAKRLRIFQFSQTLKSRHHSFGFTPLINRIDTNFMEYADRSPMSYLQAYLVRVLRSPVLAGTFLNLIPTGPLRRAIARASLIRIEEPYQFLWAYKNNPGKVPLVLVCHNHEYNFYYHSGSVLNTPLFKFLHHKVRRQETFALKKANAIIVLTRELMEELSSDYGISQDKFTLIPSPGIEIKTKSVISDHEKSLFKQKHGWKEKTVVLFAASNNPSAQEAAQWLIKNAHSYHDPSIQYVIAGSVVDGPEEKSGVYCTGYVKDILSYFMSADIALNPVTFGVGVNTRMIQYLAAGLPVITTPVGTRGLEIKSGHEAIICPREDFWPSLQDLLKDNAKRKSLGRRARRYAEENLALEKIGEKTFALYQSLWRKKIKGNLDGA